MLPIFFGFPNFQIQIFLFVSLFFLKTKGHDQIFLSDLHNYNIVGYTIAVALVFADIQFFHWKPYIRSYGWPWTVIELCLNAIVLLSVHCPSNLVRDSMTLL